MPADDFADAFKPLLKRLGQYLAAHPELRHEIGTAARAVAAWTESFAPTAAEPVAAPLTDLVATTLAPSQNGETRTVTDPARLPTVSIPSDFHIPIHPKWDEPGPSSVEATTGETGTPESTTAEIAARCRLKAEIARAFAEAATHDRVIPVESRSDWLRRSYEHKNCRLWVFDLKPLPRSVWVNLASAYEAVAAAADLLARWEQETDPTYERNSEVLHLAAEAQAVLFAATVETGYDRKEYDQIALFVQIREEGVARRLFINRYLRSSDRADPDGGPDLHRRITDAIKKTDKPASGDKEVAKLLKNLRHKLKPLTADPTGRDIDWPGVVRILDELIQEKQVPTSHVELREILIPATTIVPDEALSPAAARAFAEVDRYLESKAAPEEVTNSVRSYSQDVGVVRKLLAGRDVVFIGGLVRPERKDAIELAFDLRELNWVSVPDHSSTALFEAPIARPNVAVVIIATRWICHDYQNVREFCIKHGKHFVKLPAGYHPNQIAAAILSQVGQKLHAAE